MRTGDPGLGVGAGESRIRGALGDSGASWVGHGSSRPETRSPGATVHRVRSRAFVCCSLGNRVSSAPSPGRSTGSHFGFLLPSASHSPALASLHLWALGVQPSLAAGTCLAHCPPEHRWGAAPGPASVSCAGPTAPSDPASGARGSTGTAWPSGLLHRAHSGCQRPILPLLARGPDRTARRGPWTPSPTPPSWSLP